MVILYMPRELIIHSLCSTLHLNRKIQQRCLLNSRQKQHIYIFKRYLRPLGLNYFNTPYLQLLFKLFTIY